MKNIFWIALLFFTSVGCKVVENTELSEDSAIVMAPPPRIVKGEVMGNVFNADRTDTTVSSIAFEYYSPQFSSLVMDSSYKDSVNRMIYRLADSETIGLEYAEETALLTTHFFQTRIDSFVAMAQREVDYLESMPWQIEMQLSITEAKSYVTLNNSGWDYTGGAHGNYWDFYQLFDKKTGKILNLSDFFTDIEALNKLALPYFKEQNDVPSDMTLEEYGFWFEGDDFQVTENFYFTEEAIVFHYNIYEIAPYAGGTNDLTLPFAVLGELFKGKD